MNPIIPVFIASPSDVARERDIAEQAVQSLAPRLAELFGVTMVPVRWEQFAPISSADASHPQLDILRRIEPYSIFIGILGRKYGTPVPRLRVAGTEAEFNHALKNRDRISILAYFRDTSKGKDAKKDTRIDKLKQRLFRKNVWCSSFKGNKEFANRILVDLMETSLRMILRRGPTDLRRYAEFFRFGHEARMGSYPILIAYPPITEPGPGGAAAKFPWRERLLPRVVFEDLKVVQDIEGIMRILHREYRTVTTDSPELLSVPPGDRVWVCVPRNLMAREILKELDSRTRFSFQRATFEGGSEELYIRWKALNGKEIRIRSPLAKYLANSKRPDKASYWKPLYGYTYGRDYGILSRFQVSPGPPAVEWQRYYHYFVGGIRGLGTWGVGWFLDHCTPQLEQSTKNSRRYKAQGKEDVQILLEVVYENYRVVSVRDVGNQNQRFFEERISDRYIQEQLSRAQSFS
jgi:hypothetical protein